MEKFTVHIADISEISRQGISALLSRCKWIKAIRIHSSGKELVKAYTNNSHAVCIISSAIHDINLQDIMQRLISINPEAKAIVISGSSDIVHINRALNAGVKGYVTRQISGRELEKSVMAVWNNEQSFSKNVSKTIIEHYADSRNLSQDSKELLTKREREILNLIVKGLTSLEIANRLYISPRTVETHRSNLMQKLKIKNTAGLVRFALEEGEIW